ncbi:MAG: hypothetical protein WCE81_10090 [Halobacteriota archaeon]
MEILAGFSISKRLAELVNNLSELEEAQLNNQSKIELYVGSYATPLSVLPLAVYADRFGLSIYYTKDSNSNYCSYLDTIGFPRGMTNSCSSEKSYLAIRKLSVVREDKTLGDYVDRIFSLINLPGAFGLSNSLETFTSELVANVRQHAEVKNYWVFAQYYEKARPKTCEIVIADTGIGYKKSYESHKIKAETDTEAIQNALEGISSKPGDGRGYGIQNVASLSLKGFGGKLVIMTGKSIMYYKRYIKKATKEVELSYGWGGSVVCVNFTPRDLDDWISYML